MGAASAEGTPPSPLALPSLLDPTLGVAAPLAQPQHARAALAPAFLPGTAISPLLLIALPPQCFSPADFVQTLGINLMSTNAAFFLSAPHAFCALLPSPAQCFPSCPTPSPLLQQYQQTFCQVQTFSSVEPPCCCRQQASHTHTHTSNTTRCDREPPHLTVLRSFFNACLPCSPRCTLHANLFCLPSVPHLPSTSAGPL